MSKENGAILSDCGLYRYALWRTILDIPEGGGSVVGYFGVNPSTADHTIDDQTVKKWRGFSEVIPNHIVSRFIVGNLFSFRSTDVNGLKSALDPVGRHTDAWLDQIILKCDILIPCWGNRSKLPTSLRYRVDEVEDKLKKSGKPVLCFGKTKSGCPKHPLMLGYNTKITPYFEEKL